MPAIRRYARRPWMEIEAAKRGYWAEEFLRPPSVCWNWRSTSET